MHHSDCVLTFFFLIKIVIYNCTDRELSDIAHSILKLGQKIIDLKVVSFFTITLIYLHY